MNDKKYLLSVLSVSALIGGVVGGIFGLYDGGSPYPGIVQGLLAGILIGFISQYAFIYVHVKFSRHPALAFAVVLCVIAAGTLLFCAASGITFPFQALTILLMSEVAGLAATVLIFRYQTRINDKLREKQRELEEGGKK